MHMMSYEEKIAVITTCIPDAGVLSLNHHDVGGSFILKKNMLIITQCCIYFPTKLWAFHLIFSIYYERIAYNQQTVKWRFYA